MQHEHPQQQQQPSPSAWEFEKALLFQSLFHLENCTEELVVTLESIHSLLTDRPQLAATREGEMDRSPLHELCRQISLLPLCFQVDNTIVEAYCRVTQCLLALHPDGIAQCDAQGLLPIHCLMNGSGDWQEDFFCPILSCLLEAYPDSATIRPATANWRGLSPIEVSFAKNCSLRIRTVLISTVQDKTTGLHSFYLTQESGVFSMELAQSTEQILKLPQLAKFECHVRHWDPQAYLHILHVLSNKEQPRYLQHIGCLTIPPLWRNFAANGKNISAVPLALQRVMESSLVARGTLQTIRFRIPYGSERDNNHANDEDDSPLVSSIHDGLAKRTKMRELEMENFVIRNIALLQRWLTSGCCPRKVQFTEVMIGGGSQQPPPAAGFAADSASHDLSSSASISHDNNGEDSTGTATVVCSGDSFVKDLQFSRCSVATNDLVPLLHGIAQMRCLKRLHLEMSKHSSSSEQETDQRPMVHDQDLTSGLVAILNQTPLTELEVHGDFWGALDMEAICSESLRDNTTLQTWNVEASLNTEEKREFLANTLAFNTTLLQVTNIDWKYGKENGSDHETSQNAGKIYYGLLLNRGGRGKIRKGGNDYTKPQWVQLLIDAVAKFGHATLDTLNVHFGLLQENPNAVLGDHDQMEQSTTRFSPTIL
ncbi:expressed unknown protein [Seminavis robusta]|uniref:Uncharacterized protein n=1 Tax=Seminavis robusta TaxID=568900 RepID=A0A9N8DWC9_9STRA|nr:expressed unknown protein [Seminavis robusta]|eukprot:Sro392_g133390.1 n/a (653) ;mRNA; f:33384-35342